MTEEWRAIEGFEDRYQVSNLGRVKSLAFSYPVRTAAGGTCYRHSDETILSAHLSGGGRGRRYKTVTLKRRGKKSHRYVHRLVCAAFHGPPPKGKRQVAHWDGDAGNNRVDNLRWASVAENVADKIRHGTTPSGSEHPSAVLSKAAIRLIREVNISSQDHLFAEVLGVSESTIRNARLGHTYKT